MERSMQSCFIEHYFILWQYNETPVVLILAPVVLNSISVYHPGPSREWGKGGVSYPGPRDVWGPAVAEKIQSTPECVI